MIYTVHSDAQYTISFRFGQGANDILTQVVNQGITQIQRIPLPGTEITVTTALENQDDAKINHVNGRNILTINVRH